jgi:hypothetical protein
MSKKLCKKFWSVYWQEIIILFNYFLLVMFASEDCSPLIMIPLLFLFEIIYQIIVFIGLTRDGEIKTLLRSKGYEKISFLDVRLLWEKSGWRFDWIKKLPPRDEVALTPVYQDDLVDSLLACAEILLSQKR